MKDNLPLPTTKRLSPAQWVSAVALYELGYKNHRELAQQFGISVTAIQKGLKKRNATKGSRVEETLVDLKLELARRLLLRLRSERLIGERMERRSAMIGGLIEQIVEADRTGALVDMNPLFEQVRRVF